MNRLIYGVGVNDADYSVSRSRYTAEWRGGDNGDVPWEWCVVDEEVGWTGSAIVLGLTEEQAIKKAKEMNKQKEQHDV